MNKQAVSNKRTQLEIKRLRDTIETLQKLEASQIVRDIYYIRLEAVLNKMKVELEVENEEQSKY